MKHLRGVRRAGVLALAAMAVAGCSAGGGTEPSADPAGEEPAAADIEFTEESGIAAIEAVVPTAQVVESEEIYASLEETVAQLEEMDSTDSCTDLAVESYRDQLENRSPQVQGVIAEEALLEPGAFESLSIATVGASEETEEGGSLTREDCLEDTDELTTEESTLGECDVVEEQYTRSERSARWTVVMTCQEVQVMYNLTKEGAPEGEFGEWSEGATSRATKIFDQLAS
ncbi:MAG: hypothetical protein ACTHWF_13925 [Brachybacterium sp.]